MCESHDGTMADEKHGGSVDLFSVTAGGTRGRAAESPPPQILTEHEGCLGVSEGQKISIHS